MTVTQRRHTTPLFVRSASSVPFGSQAKIPAAPCLAPARTTFYTASDALFFVAILRYLFFHDRDEAIGMFFVS